MKQLLFIFFVLIGFGTAAQQGLQMNFTETDSTQMELARQMEYYQLITGNIGGESLLGKVDLPDFSFQQELQKRYTFSFEVFPISSFSFAGISSGPFGAYSPFYHNGTVLSAAAYQLGDKFVIGGYSYGANTIHAAPYPNQSANYFDTYGSTMFMQYKVSKKFKIETRISVGQRQGPGF
ncbi:MAG: hypothetical protein ABFS16_00450 [Bacteroidota bacterium]